MASTGCIVTGGAGFIGCAISKGLIERFGRVVAVDNLHPQVHKTASRPAALAAGVELLRLDITEPATWDAVLAELRPTAIVHLAAETGTGQSLTEATRHAHVNVTGTTVMLDALARHKVVPERILLTSSRAVYGEGAWQDRAAGQTIYPGYRSREQLARGEWDFMGLHALPSSAMETRAMPTNVYGSTKLAQEHILCAWAAAFGTVPTTLRLQNVYGPGQSLSNSYTGIVSLFCRIARAQRSIPLYEDGRMLRDFVLIDDVADALLLALSASAPGNVPLDVGTGVATTIGDIAVHIASLYNAPEPHVCALYRFGDVRHAACTINLTRQMLAWEPRFSVQDGLLRLKGWVDIELAAGGVD
ncbi:MAG: NAD-dependent epimerase/dehydratase family protein [Rhodopila sp.]|nr:NAD-dependent epimerase/dehydratase family protein [Rhodopila sp.]